MSTHYVARVVVEKIEKAELQSTAGRMQAVPVETKRTKATIASFTVSATDLEAVKDRIAKHVALVEDGGDIE